MLYFTFDLILLVGWRVWMRLHKSEAADRVRVLGSRQRAHDVVRRLAKSTGYKVVGCLDLDESMAGAEVYAGVRVLGSMEPFNEILVTQSIDEVVFAIPVTQVPRGAQYLDFAERIGVVVRFVPECGVYKILYSPEITRMFLENY